METTRTSKRVVLHNIIIVYVIINGDNVKGNWGGGVISGREIKGLQQTVPPTPSHVSG